MAIISTLNLILALLSLFGESSPQEMLPSILINGVILIYLLDLSA